MAVPQYNGVDVPILAFKPNWDGAAFELEPDWDDTISEALSTRENRQGTRPRPLYNLEFTILTESAAQTATLRRILDLAEDLPVGVPIWSETMKLAAETTASTGISVDWYANNMLDHIGHLILVQAYNNFEVLGLDTWTDTTTIIVDPAVSAGIPAGTEVVPLIFGYLERGRIEDMDDEKGYFNVRFEEKFLGISNQTVLEGSATDDTSTATTLADMGSFTGSLVSDPLPALWEMMTANITSSPSDLPELWEMIAKESIETSALSGSDQYALLYFDQQILNGPEWKDPN